MELPRLELSGPILARAFETLVAGTDAQGGIEQWIDALKLKSRMFQQALGGLVDGGGQNDSGAQSGAQSGAESGAESGAQSGAEAESGLPLDSFKSLCAFMASVRRRVGPYLEQPDYDALVAALQALLAGARDTTTTDARLADFCRRFPPDREHRWVRDLAAEVLHNVDPERYPLMCRWVWDRKANTGVIREIWFGDDVDHVTLGVPDGYATCLVLREELSQYLTDNGVFRDVIWYVDLLCAKIYADYIAAQGGVYLRADFSAPGDPMQHVRRLLGLDGVRAGAGERWGRTRLKAITGEAFVIEDSDLLD
jgi:hypothetical protein